MKTHLFVIYILRIIAKEISLKIHDKLVGSNLSYLASGSKPVFFRKVPIIILGNDSSKNNHIITLQNENGDILQRNKNGKLEFVTPKSRFDNINTIKSAESLSMSINDAFTAGFKIFTENNDTLPSDNKSTNENDEEVHSRFEAQDGLCIVAGKDNIEMGKCNDINSLFIITEKDNSKDAKNSNNDASSENETSNENDKDGKSIQKPIEITMNTNIDNINAMDPTSIEFVNGQAIIKYADGRTVSKELKVITSNSPAPIESSIKQPNAKTFVGPTKTRRSKSENKKTFNKSGRRYRNRPTRLLKHKKKPYNNKHKKEQTYSSEDDSIDNAENSDSNQNKLITVPKDAIIMIPAKRHKKSMNNYENSDEASDY